MKFQPMEYKLEQFLETDKMSEIINGAPKVRRFLSKAKRYSKVKKRTSVQKQFII